MSCTSESTTQAIWKFSVDRAMNTGTMSISDELIDNEEIATERATSEFIKNSYTTNTISFVANRSDLEINDEISIDSKLYLVKNISIDMNGVSEIYTITAQRYD